MARHDAAMASALQMNSVPSAAEEASNMEGGGPKAAKATAVAAQGGPATGTEDHKCRPLLLPVAPPRSDNGTDAHRGLSARRPTTCCRALVPSLGNFNIAYNFTSASIAIKVLSTALSTRGALYPEPTWSQKVSLAVVFVGSMVGMLVMGRLGDILGRKKAMRMTLLLSISGSLIPALMGGSPDLAYVVLCIGRFTLGVGVGGIYPLAAVAAAESQAEEEALQTKAEADSSGGNCQNATPEPGRQRSRRSRGHRVGWALFWQAPAVAFPYALAIALVYFIGEDFWSSQWVFRLLFALGAVPAAVVLLAGWHDKESEEFLASRRAARAQAERDASAVEEHPAAVRHQPVRPRRRRRMLADAVATIWSEPWEVRKTLLGTAGTWFLYDIADYGTITFTPDILQSICMTGHKVPSGDGCEQTMIETSLEACIVALMGVPGCMLAVVVAGTWGSKRLNSWGFALLALNFGAMALIYARWPTNSRLLFAMLCCLMFLLNFGPNVGTYVLPAICFPTHVRSTLHGASAFAGKLGAVAGTLAFPAISSSSVGFPGVLATQAAICLFGAALSAFLLRHDWDYEALLLEQQRFQQ